MFFRDSLKVENMEKKVILAMVFVLILGAFTLAVAMQQDISENDKVDKFACLACHGPFDEIAAATADYTAPSGETVTPHQYIPHAEKQEIPQCVECHVMHPIPFESKGKMVKPDNINFCYANCHHAQNLQPCSACH